MKKQTESNEIQLAVKSDKAVISREKKTTRILEISITPPEKDQSNTRAPLNLSLVLDRSGSMSGEKLDYVKRAAIHVLDLLDEKDQASVVVYNSEIQTIVPSGNLTEIFRKQAIHKVSTIQSGGSTNLSGGWLKGCEQVASGADGHTINRALLLTDGQANEGIQDAEELATHARELFRRGVSTSCFGVGLGYDEHLLEGMANNGGGNFHFLETINAIPVVFEREFNELVDITLRDVELVIKLPKGVRSYVAAGWPHEFKDDRMILTLGGLYVGRTQKVYVTLKIDPISTEVEPLFPVTLRGKDKNEYIVELAGEIRFASVSSDEEEKSALDQSLMERFTVIEMADKANEALKHEREGDRAGASKILNRSIMDHQANMSAPMRSKFQFMASQMEQGLDANSRKRYHQEEYFNKRSRDFIRDYRLELINGHLVAQIEKMSVLIDTGIPISIGDQNQWHFLNKVHDLSSSYMGVTPEYISRMTGSHVNVILGADILKMQPVTIHQKQQRITFGENNSLDPSKGFLISDFMGIPIIKTSIDKIQTDAFIDTGSKLSYVEKSIAAPYPTSGVDSDFYPGIGEFETQIYEIPFSIGTFHFTLRCGVLPDLLGKALFVTGKKVILGTELFEKFEVVLDFPEKMIWLKNC